MSINGLGSQRECPGGRLPHSLSAAVSGVPAPGVSLLAASEAAVRPPGLLKGGSALIVMSSLHPPPAAKCQTALPEGGMGWGGWGEGEEAAQGTVNVHLIRPLTADKMADAGGAGRELSRSRRLLEGTSQPPEARSPQREEASSLPPARRAGFEGVPDPPR